MKRFNQLGNIFFMSSYRTHTTFNLSIALPLFLGGILYWFHPHRHLIIAFGVSFAYATLFMSPDLDLAYQIRIFSWRGIFSLPFRLYARLFRHRGLSHHFLFGSLTRIVWLFCWFVLVFFIYYQTFPKVKEIQSFYVSYKSYLIYSFAGICLADWCHLLLDYKGRRQTGRSR